MADNISGTSEGVHDTFFEGVHDTFNFESFASVYGEVKSTGPKGGDAGHGGKLELTLHLRGDFEAEFAHAGDPVESLGDRAIEIKVIAWGDAEMEALTRALGWAYHRITSAPWRAGGKATDPDDDLAPVSGIDPAFLCAAIEDEVDPREDEVFREVFREIADGSNDCDVDAGEVCRG